MITQVTICCQHWKIDKDNQHTVTKGVTRPFLLYNSCIDRNAAT